MLAAQDGEIPWKIDTFKRKKSMENISSGRVRENVTWMNLAQNCAEKEVHLEGKDRSSECDMWQRRRAVERRVRSTETLLPTALR
jgi:hypothetical protein